MNQTNRRRFLGTLAGAPFLSIRTRRSWGAEFGGNGCADRRQELLAKMELVMGPFPRQKRKPPLDVKTLESIDLPTHTRASITFVSEEGDPVPAYLLLPKKSQGPAAAMLCLHQTTRLGAGEPAGVGGDANLHYAQELAERGYVTIAPDYPDLPLTPGFGGYRFDAYRHGYASNTMKGIWNHTRAVDLLESLPAVDAERIGCIGHSLGGHNTLFAGAFDQRLRVLVTSSGFTSFAKYYGGELCGWSQLRYMPLIATQYHDNPNEMPFDFSDVLAALAPRPVFINAPLRDDNFDFTGVDDVVRTVIAACPGEFGTGGRLVVKHPDAPHSFPPEVRQEAYAFLDKWLRHKSRGAGAA
jgi:dienelactone hydrolase